MLAGGIRPSRGRWTAIAAGVGLLALSTAVLACGGADQADPVENAGGERSGEERGQPSEATAGPDTDRRPDPPRPRLQRTATLEGLTPRPVGGESRGDRGAIWDRGCMMQPEDTRSPRCVFGERSSDRTAVLFGDSHALHLFEAVHRLARHQGWRLIALTKAGCPPFATPVYNPRLDRVHRECAAWQRHSLRRIERERPEIVLTSGAVLVKPMREGRVLRSGAERRRLLRAGYERMLERLLDTGARVVAIKDVPMAPHDMTDCVAENLDRLERCAFRKPPGYERSFDSRAAEAVDGVEEVDLSPGICRGQRCFGVIRDMLAYRDHNHLTATFAGRALAPWLARELNRGGD